MALLAVSAVILVLRDPLMILVILGGPVLGYILVRACLHLAERLQKRSLDRRNTKQAPPPEVQQPGLPQGTDDQTPM
jgi:hypothetical protein